MASIQLRCDDRSCLMTNPIYGWTISPNKFGHCFYSQGQHLCDVVLFLQNSGQASQLHMVTYSFLWLLYFLSLKDIQTAWEIAAVFITWYIFVITKPFNSIESTATRLWMSDNNTNIKIINAGDGEKCHKSSNLKFFHDASKAKPSTTNSVVEGRTTVKNFLAHYGSGSDHNVKWPTNHLKLEIGGGWG